MNIIPLFLIQKLEERKTERYQFLTYENDVYFDDFEECQKNDFLGSGLSRLNRWPIEQPQAEHCANCARENLATKLQYATHAYHKRYTSVAAHFIYQFGSHDTEMAWKPLRAQEARLRVETFFLQTRRFQVYQTG